MPNDPIISAKQAVINLAGRCAAHGWTPATAGNFSVRVDATQIAITATGVYKGTLTLDEVLILPLDQDPPAAASAEAPIHWHLYRAHKQIGAVAHFHGPALTVLSVVPPDRQSIRLAGWEMLKILPGIRTHDTYVDIPVLPNTQDMLGLAARLSVNPDIPALILAGHGMYAWGADIEAAWRHAEALEYMCELEVYRMRLER